MTNSNFSTNEKQNALLLDVVKDFDENSYAILYSPKKCHLALFDGTNFVDANGTINVSDVYEARVFNADEELRWVNEADGKGNSIIISDANLPDAIGTIRQKYLLWGKKNGASLNGWTQFSEARIGAFYVPVTLTNKEYAVFEAIEYLGEFEDGNVAVFEERLIGISEVK